MLSENELPSAESEQNLQVVVAPCVTTAERRSAEAKKKRRMAGLPYLTEITTGFCEAAAGTGTSIVAEAVFPDRPVAVTST